MFSIIVLLTVIGTNAHTTSNESNSIDYFSPNINCNVLFDNVEDHLPLKMIVIDSQNSGLLQMIEGDETVKQSVLYWLHFRIFQLIDSSFLYDVDSYTSNIWNEYCLNLLSVSNSLRSSTLSINIVVSQTEIEQIISNVLETNGKEVSAYIRFKLTDLINNYYEEFTVNDLYVNLMLVSATTTEQPLIIHEKMSNTKIYILIIALCMLIIIISLCIYKRIQKSIKDIKSLVIIRDKLFNIQSKQLQKNEIVSEPISIKSISDGSNLTNQIDENKNDSPAVPIMDVNIFKQPLPLMMQKGPSSDSFSNLTVLPPKQKSKSSIELYDINHKQGTTIISNISNVSIIIDRQPEQKNSIASYDDTDKISTFRIIDDNELGDTLFNCVVTD